MGKEREKKVSHPAEGLDSVRETEAQAQGARLKITPSKKPDHKATKANALSPNTLEMCGNDR